MKNMNVDERWNSVPYITMKCHWVLLYIFDISVTKTFIPFPKFSSGIHVAKYFVQAKDLQTQF